MEHVDPLLVTPPDMNDGQAMAEFERQVQWSEFVPHPLRTPGALNAALSPSDRKVSIE